MNIYHLLAYIYTLLCNRWEMFNEELNHIPSWMMGLKFRLKVQVDGLVQSSRVWNCSESHTNKS